MLLIADRMVLVSGQISTREGERPKIRGARIIDIKEAWEQPNMALQLRLSPDAVANGQTQKLFDTLGAHPGQTPVVLSVSLPDEDVTIRASRYSVKVSDGFLSDLETLLGDRAVQVRRNGAID